MIDHVGVPVSDLERSLDFYRDVLGFEVDFVAEGRGPGVSEALGLEQADLVFAFLRVGDTRLELLEYKHPVGRANDRRNCDVGAAHVAFEVPDVEAEYERLTARGVSFSARPISVDSGPLAGCAFAYFRDPDGIQLELFSRPATPASGAS